MSRSRKSGQNMRAISRPVLHLLVLLGLGLATYRLYQANTFALPSWATWSRGTADDDFQRECLNFKPQISGARIDLVEHLNTDGKAKLSYRDVSCGGPGFSAPVAQDVCRVALYVSTSTRSGIHFEAWLPKSWNTRFLGTGNGGLNGCLDYASLAYTTAHGFAAVASNNGHNGTDGKFFYNNADVLHDFADRSLHTSTVVGKSLVKQFYGTEHKKSYYLGCSQGGRQGIANAMKFPTDFDGIVAGAPALDFNSLVSWRASFFPLTGPYSSDPAEFIAPDVWSGLIHDEIMRQCDHLDGVVDGIIEYPDLCEFQPEVLRCKAGTIPDGSCLSDQQIRHVGLVFSPFTHTDGTLIFPGMQLGSEKKAIDRLYSGKPFTDSRDWFKYVVHSDPSWDPATFTTADAKKAQELDPFEIRTFPTSYDLQRFREKGGKILSYHGMQDQQITGHNTARWLEHLRSQSSYEEIEDWLRYFRISGLFHCSGGPGAWMIGQTGGSVTFEPHKNILSAVVEWVENGLAPDVLEGTKLAAEGKAQEGGTAAVQFTRRHCRYPKRNRYIGPSLNHEENDAGRVDLPHSSIADEWICD